MEKKIIIFMCLVITSFCFADWNEARSSDRIREKRIENGDFWNGVHIYGIKEIEVFKNPEEDIMIDVEGLCIQDFNLKHKNIGMAITVTNQKDISIIPQIDRGGELINRGDTNMVVISSGNTYEAVKVRFHLKPSAKKEFTFQSAPVINDKFPSGGHKVIYGVVKIISPLAVSAPDLELGKMMGSKSIKPNTPIKTFDLKVKGNENSRVEIKWDSQVEIENEKGDELPIGIQIKREGEIGDGKLSYDLDSQGKGDAKIIVNTGKNWPLKLKTGKYSGQVKIRVGYK